MRYTFGRLVMAFVRPRGRDEVGVAARAGDAGRRGVRRDVDDLGLLDGRPHRDHHVREHHPGHQVDAVALEQPLGELLAGLGVERVVGEHDLGGQAAQLAARHLYRQVEAVPDLDADRARRARQRRQVADLQLVGGLRVK
jgi:hypothetical protein